MLRSALLLGLVCCVTQAAPDPARLCRNQTAAAEKKLAKHDNAGALLLLESTVDNCRQAKSPSGRAYLLLGTIYFQMNAVEKAAALFEEALAVEPGQTVAAMDLGACQMLRGQFDAAIATTQRALTGDVDKHTRMQANFNIGLAYVKKAAATAKAVDPRAKNYFQEAQKLEPAFGGNYHYLGLIAESLDRDFSAAKGLYREGCQRGFSASCQLLASIDQRALAEHESKVALAKPLSPENEARLLALRTAYARRYDARSALSVITGLRQSCRTVSPQQCRIMLDHTLAALQ